MQLQHCAGAALPDPPTKDTVKLRMQNKPLLHSSGMDRSTEHLADVSSGSDGIPFNSIQLSKYGLATGRAGAISWMHGSLAWKGEAISRVTPITYFKHVMSGWTKSIPGALKKRRHHYCKIAGASARAMSGSNVLTFPTYRWL